MTAQELEDYFDAVDWFGQRYGKENVDSVIKTMYLAWPKTTLLLLGQGFFAAVANRN